MSMLPEQVLTGRDGPRLVAIYGAWCWNLKVPLVWSERRSPRSRYGRIHLDMFTTAQMLTAAAQAEMKALGANFSVRASPHDACCNFVPMRDLERLARTVLRTALRSGNSEPNRVKIASIEAGRAGKVLAFDLSRQALA
jgi:hypothetical protein